MGQDEGSTPRPTFDAPFGVALAKLGAQNPKIVGLTADLGKYTDILPFRDAFPERFFNIGMAEQNLVAVAPAWRVSGRCLSRRRTACSRRGAPMTSSRLRVRAFTT